MGAKSWSASQHGNDEPSDQASRLDAEKKTLGASQRREEERGKFREQRKQVDAQRLVVAEECGSNIALSPFDALAPKGERAQGSVPRNPGRIRPGSPPCRSTGSPLR